MTLLLELLGVALIVAGVALCCIPAAFIVAGAFVLTAALFIDAHGGIKAADPEVQA